jgi:soluble lytic murein transglycosylase
MYVDNEGVAHFTNAPTHREFKLFQEGHLPKRSRTPGKMYETLIHSTAKEHRMDPALIQAVIQAESNFDPYAVSRKGAQGLMQLLPQTAWALSVQDPFDPRANIKGGTSYLRQLLDRFSGDLSLALAAYNAGEDAVRRYGGIPPYQETKQYVTKVLSLYNKKAPSPSSNASSNSKAKVPQKNQPPPSRVYRSIDENGLAYYSNIPPLAAQKRAGSTRTQSP